MKARTKAILAAAEIINLEYPFGVCDAIALTDQSACDWFHYTFRPLGGNLPRGIDDCFAYWLGWRTPENLERRLTFIAMAAAVSETEP